MTIRSEPPTGSPARDRGFALPAAIFALVVIALLVTAGFFMAGQERRIGLSAEAAAEARILAEQGVADVAATWVPGASPPQEWAATILRQGQGQSGTWEVEIARVDENLYVARSTGVVTERGRFSGATRTVVQLLKPGVFDLVGPEAALVTRNELDIQGGASLVDGRDSNGPTGGGGPQNAPYNMSGVCPPASGGKPAVLIDNATDFSRHRNSDLYGVDSNGNVRTGDDAVSRDDALVEQTLDVFDDDVWAGLVSMANKSVSGNAFPQNIGRSYHTVDGDTRCNYSDPYNWGTPRFDAGAVDELAYACQNYLPIVYISPRTGGDWIRINGGSEGQGILLVEGNLWLNGNFNWAGPIYVRGGFHNNGGTGMYGGVVSLGAQVGADTTVVSQTVSGNAQITYSSCAISRAINAASGNLPMRPLSRRSWADLTVADF